MASSTVPQGSGTSTTFVMVLCPAPSTAIFCPVFALLGRATSAASLQTRSHSPGRPGAPPPGGPQASAGCGVGLRATSCSRSRTMQLRCSGDIDEPRSVAAASANSRCFSSAADSPGSSSEAAAQESRERGADRTDRPAAAATACRGPTKSGVGGRSPRTRAERRMTKEHARTTPKQERWLCLRLPEASSGRCRAIVGSVL
mmetsp:Transcript_26457/g.46848  ORF Transcript_26457/g.46848 Transcript_26457/m.46848 type:complete len:201 (+) Transcript_26457:252-854(+)